MPTTHVCNRAAWHALRCAAQSAREPNRLRAGYFVMPAPVRGASGMHYYQVRYE